MATSTASFCTSPNISALFMTTFLPVFATADGFRSSDTDFTIILLFFASLLIFPILLRCRSGSWKLRREGDEVDGGALWQSLRLFFLFSDLISLILWLEIVNETRDFSESERIKRFNFFFLFPFWNLLPLLQSVSNRAVGECKKFCCPLQLAIRRRFDTS